MIEVDNNPDNIFKRLDDWWLKGSFPTFEWSIYLLVAQIENDIMWLIEMESEEDGFYPRKIYTAWRYIDTTLAPGDLIYIDFYEKPVKFIIEKNAIAEQEFMVWFEEQIKEKYQNLDSVMFYKREVVRNDRNAK